MRVALVDPGHQLPGYCHSLASALARSGAECSFVTAPLLHYAAQSAPGLHVHLAFGRLLGREGSWLRRLAGRAKIRRILRALSYPFEWVAFIRWAGREKIDLVHLQWSLAPRLDALALRALRRLGVATVYTVHNALPHEPRPWHAPAYRRLYASPDRLILHSQASETRLTRGLGQPGPPMERMEMPADPVLPAGDRGAARRRLDLPLDAPLLLFFGHARPYKGLELLLEAWPQVAATRPEARLLIAGKTAGGPEGKAALGTKIAAAGADSILWRPGFVPSAQAPDFFAAADLVALPYLDSDHSAVATAARGYGRAVVATAVGGLPEALARGGGLLLPPADPAAMAAGILGLLDHPERRAALEAEALAAARAWTWDDAARLSLEIYARAMAGPRSGDSGRAR